MRTLNLPHSWEKMSAYQKSCYLVNTHQAQGFSEAGRIIARKKAIKREFALPPIIRLPYAEN